MNISIKIKEINVQNVEAIVSGEIDAYTAPELKKALTPFSERESCVLTVDLRNVKYMDSTALGVLVGIFKSLRAHDGELFLVGLSERLYRLFEITGLCEIMEIRKMEGEKNGNHV